MSSVSVNRPGGLDTRRGSFEKTFVWMLRGLLPPANDNKRAADFLHENIGASNPFVRFRDRFSRSEPGGDLVEIPLPTFPLLRLPAATGILTRVVGMTERAARSLPAPARGECATREVAAET